MHNTPIYDFTPLSLLDFPNKMACIVWFAGCNMRCPYCYNVDIVKGNGTKSVEEVSLFLKKRAGKLDGVVFSGGECTLHPKALKQLALVAKELGYAVKIDTNGTNSKVLEELISESLVDYIALDFKAPSGKMRELTQLNSAFLGFENSLKLLQNSVVPFELRTTIHASLLSKESLCEMDKYLQKNDYKNTWFWQEFIDAPKTIGSIKPSVKNYGKKLISDELNGFESKIVVRE